jgi:hypothetical protein
MQGAEMKEDSPVDWLKHWKVNLARCDIADGKVLIFTERCRDGLRPEIKDSGPDLKVYQRVGTRKSGDVTAVQYWRVDGADHLTNHAKALAKRARVPPIDRSGAGEIRAGFSVTWAEIVESDDPRHLVAGTRCLDGERASAAFAAPMATSVVISSRVAARLMAGPEPRPQNCGY